MSVALGYSGLVHGLANLLPLLAAPFVAFRWYRSGRVAGLVALWVLVLGAAGVLLLLWVFRDFQFRGPGR